jgi:2-oxoisovalerate dehydrogenase E1 component alpha subunit
MGSAISGDSKIAAAWIGDGSTAESDFPRRARLRLDLQGARRPQYRQQPVGHLDLPGHRPRRRGHIRRTRAMASASRRCVSTATTISAVHAVGKWAVERARANLGPTLVEYVTYRAGGHSTSDDPAAYRPKQESEAWPLGDPILRLKNHLMPAASGRTSATARPRRRSWTR